MKLAWLAMAVVLTGCIDMSYQMTHQFDPSEYVAYAGHGDGAIVGQAFLRQRSGRVVTCAGESVVLVPATGYTREWAMSMGSGLNVKGAEISRIDQVGAGRGLICDANGVFQATGLKPGRWIALTDVFWYAGNEPQGGVLWGETQVQPGQTAQLILTR